MICHGEMVQDQTGKDPEMDKEAGAECRVAGEMPDLVGSVYARYAVYKQRISAVCRVCKWSVPNVASP